MGYQIILANILLRKFKSIFIRDVGLQSLFLIVSFSGFGTKVMLVSQKKLGRIPSLLIISQQFKIGLDQFFPPSLTEFNSESFDPGIFFWGGSLLTIQYPCWLLVYFIQVFYLCTSVLVIQIVQKSIHFFSRFSKLLTYSCL